MLSSEAVIKVENLGKVFRIYASPWMRMLDWLGKERRYREFVALEGISFVVEKGSCFGIIGPNGAGKSTLLKILTGALFPSRGSYDIEGRPLSLLELGTGFNPELSGRDNLFSSAALLGIEESAVREKLDEIVEFAELGEFIDRPLKLYSSGMQVRLAFSLFAYLEPEVLIVDEALSVGDIFFQQKCFARMQEIMAQGTTCLFVSHDMGAIEKFCDQVMLLEKGKMEFIGPANEAINRYYATLGASQGIKPIGGSIDADRHDEIHVNVVTPKIDIIRNLAQGISARHGDRLVEIISIGVLTPDGRETLQVEMMQKLEFRLRLLAHAKIGNFRTGINLYDRFGTLVFAAGCRQLEIDLPSLTKGEQLEVSLFLELRVQPGEYTFSIGVSSPVDGPDPNTGVIHDRIEHLGPLLVVDNSGRIKPFYGVAQLPLEISWCRVKEGEILAKLS